MSGFGDTRSIEKKSFFTNLNTSSNNFNNSRLESEIWKAAIACRVENNTNNFNFILTNVTEFTLAPIEIRIIQEHIYRDDSARYSIQYQLSIALENDLLPFTLFLLKFFVSHEHFFFANIILTYKYVNNGNVMCETKIFS